MDNQWRFTVELSRMTFIADRPRHGIRTTYETHKCRCDPCREWRRDYRQSVKGTPCHQCKTNPRNASGLCNPCSNTYARRTYKSEVHRRWKIRRTYGIEPEEYDALLEKQHGVCAICENVNASGKKLAVDHDHVTGRIRGLLCSRCNLALGLIGDTSESAQRAVDYLESSR